ncbi:MAG: MYXO-CTERM sorting domain-containing protein [Sandaracinaceae bacterium]
MKRFDFGDLARPFYCLMFALTVFACDGGGCSGCDGCGIEPIPGAYPIDQRIDNAAQIRLTSSGIDFVEDNIDGIVTSFLPDGLDFPVPEVNQDVAVLGTIRLCSGDDCSAHLEIEDLELTPTAPNQIQARIRLVLDSRNAAGDREEWVLRTSIAQCRIDIDSRRGDNPAIAAVATITFANTTQAARENYTQIQVTDVALAEDEGIENDDLDISGNRPIIDAAQCAILNLGAVKNLIIDQIEGQLGGLVDGALGDQLCTTHGEFGCPTGTFSVPDEDPESICRFENSEDSACVPILLGTDGRGDLGGTLIGGFSPGTHAYAQFLLASGQEGEAVNDGMSLFFYGGFMGTDSTFTTTPAHNPCVPMVEPPPLPEVARTEAFRGNTIPGTSTETHVGIGLSEDYLNYAGYGLFDSGALCIGAGTRLSQMLSSGLVSALVGSLPDLTFPLDNAPLTIALRPQQAPVFDVGADGALLDITLPQVEIDFYVWFSERYVRFMTFRTDLGLGIDLTVEGGQIVPALSSVTSTNSTVTNSELLEEDPTFLAGTLETLVGGLASQLGGAISPFDLPEIMGFVLNVPEGGITPVSEAGEDFLGIFANLELAATEEAFVSEVDTQLSLTDIRLDEASMAAETWNEGTGNTVWLHFAAEGPMGVDYEYSYAIDGGHWSAWTTDPRIQIDDDILLLQARHEIHARARVVGEPASMDTTPATAELLVDVLPPTVRIERLVNGIEVDANDIITPTEDLEYRYLLDGTWTAWGTLASLALPVDAEGVVIEVRDEAGNVGRAQAPLIRGLPNSAADGGCGCRVPGGDGGSVPLSVLLLLATVGGFSLRRRRRASGSTSRGARRTRARRTFPFFLGALTLIAMLASGCECSSAAPCNNQCVHAAAPSTTGSVCCEATDMCASYDIDALCDPGFTCASENLVADGTCTVSCLMCEAKPDLDPGYLATHLDAVVDSAGNVAVAGYAPGSPQEDILYGDLVFGTWDGTEMQWEMVDGVPASPITNNPDGFRGGISAPGDDVGQFASMVNQDGTYLIAYYDATNNALKMAAGGPGAWQVHTIDEAGDSGRYTSLTLDSAGIPVVSYLRIEESPDTPGEIRGAVMVATANTANPSMPTDWTLTLVAAQANPCRAEFCPSGTQCVESGACVTATSDCTEECATGDVCQAGSCVATVADNFVEDLPPFHGLHTSLAVSDTGLGLVWYDRSTGNIFGARFDGSAWSEPFLIDGYAVGDPNIGDSGLSADLQIDDAGVWHVVYVDGAEETLRYASVLPDGTVETEVVDDGSTDGTTRHMDGRHIVGDDASLVVLDSGALRVIYQDATSQNAVVAVRAAGGGEWAISPFDTENSTGYWVDQALLGTTSYAATWWVERARRGLDNGVRVFTLE